MESTNFGMSITTWYPTYAYDISTNRKKIIQDSPVVLQEGGRKNLSPEIYLKL